MMKKKNRSRNFKKKMAVLVVCVSLFIFSAGLWGCSFVYHHGFHANEEKYESDNTRKLIEKVAEGISLGNEEEYDSEKNTELSPETKEIEFLENADGLKETEVPQGTENFGETEVSEEVIIELDPGHGGYQSGAVNDVHNILEKDLNLKIAWYLKEELEKYDHITVYLTREDDREVKLEDRVEKAVQDHADMIISLHNNAAGPMADYDHGCTVLVPRGAYQEEISEIGQEAGCYILNALSEIGLENQGLMFRICQNETTYPNGELCDYYSIIRNSIKAGIPGIIVEHSFLDHEQDYENYLADDTKLKALARADAKGIAAYYGLPYKETGDVPERLRNYEEKITVIKSDDKKDNQYLTKMYFTE